MEASFPPDPVELWHATFAGPLQDDIDVLYRSARTYGDSVVDMGLAIDYLILSFTYSEQTVIHCVPVDEPSKMRRLLDYYYQIRRLKERDLTQIDE